MNSRFVVDYVDHPAYYPIEITDKMVHDMNKSRVTCLSIEDAIELMESLKDAIDVAKTANEEYCNET